MEAAKPRLLIPGLQKFYAWAEPVSYLIIRLTVGLMLIPHGWPKLMAGIGPVAANALTKRGITPAEPLAVILIAIETLGGLCIALGLFTRFWAAAATIEMCVIVYHHLPNSAGPTRLRVPADVGPRPAGSRPARRRPVLRRPPAQARAVARGPGASCARE